MKKKRELVGPLALLAVAVAVSGACSPESPGTTPPPPENGGSGGGTGGSPRPPAPTPDMGTLPPLPDASATPTPDMGSPPADSGAPRDGGPTEMGTPTEGGPPAATLVDNPLGPMPMDLKDLGLFTAIPDLTKVNPKLFGFTPRYPLWSNGTDKNRWALIPDGMKIDTNVRDAWVFPVGTLFFKHFSVKDPGNPMRSLPVETRVIRRIATTGEVFEQWEFHTYEWNAAGTAATLLDGKKRTPREVTIDGVKFTHNIPSRKDCWNCHVANKATIIGFDELRLNSRIGTAMQTQLEQVVAKGWLTKAPTAPLIEVTGRTPAERAALEYLQANCAHCHNGQPPQEPGARYPALDLRYMNAVAQTVNVMTMSVGTKAGMRIVPGDPMRSILFLAVQATANPTADPEVKPMPTVGVDRLDPMATTVLRTWIMGLPR